MSHEDEFPEPIQFAISEIKGWLPEVAQGHIERVEEYIQAHLSPKTQPETDKFRDEMYRYMNATKQVHSFNKWRAAGLPEHWTPDSPFIPPAKPPEDVQGALENEAEEDFQNYLQDLTDRERG